MMASQFPPHLSAWRPRLSLNLFLAVSGALGPMVSPTLAGASLGEVPSHRASSR
jgi:hypothetical protein